MILAHIFAAVIVPALVIILVACALARFFDH